MAVRYVKSLLLGVKSILRWFQIKKISCLNSPSTLHRLCQMQKITWVLRLYHHWERTSDNGKKTVSAFLENKICSLVNETTHISGTVRLIFTGNKLVCVPNEVYIQSWHEECGRRWSHEIQEAKEFEHRLIIRVFDRSIEDERVISGNGILECKLITHIVEKTRTSPSQLVHFRYKWTLAENLWSPIIINKKAKTDEVQLTAPASSTE